MLHRDSRNVPNHYEGVLRFRPRLLPRGSVLVLAGGVPTRRLRNDTVPATGNAGSVLQTLYHYFPSRRVI